MRRTDGGGNTTETHYNDVGQVDWVQDGADNQTSYAYYGQDELGAGRIKSVENPNAKMSRYAYTLRGEVEKVWGHVPQPP